jgi:hypothetical protein
MLMVFRSPKSKLGPKTKIPWSRGPKYCFMCIDFSYALDTNIFWQCRTLHYKTKMAPINMTEAIPTHNFIDHYVTLRKYRKHILCNTWRHMDVQVVDIVRITSENGHMMIREIHAIKPMRFIIHP